MKNLSKRFPHSVVQNQQHIRNPFHIISLLLYNDKRNKICRTENKIDSDISLLLPEFVEHANIFSSQLLLLLLWRWLLLVLLLLLGGKGVELLSLREALGHMTQKAAPILVAAPAARAGQPLVVGHRVVAALCNFPSFFVLSFFCLCAFCFFFFFSRL